MKLEQLLLYNVLTLYSPVTDDYQILDLSRCLFELDVESGGASHFDLLGVHTQIGE